MRKFSVLVLFAAWSTLSCGSGSQRQLQGITIGAYITTPGQNQLLAAGYFSAPPTGVSPLPVFWATDPLPAQYTLTTQPFVVQCGPGGYPGPITAMAPANPSAPSSGSIATTKMISASFSCTQVKE